MKLTAQYENRIHSTAC